MCAPKCRHWPMDERPASVNLVRQKRRVLIVGRHDHAESLEAAEVLRKSKRDAGSAP